MTALVHVPTQTRSYQRATVNSPFGLFLSAIENIVGEPTPIKQKGMITQLPYVEMIVSGLWYLAENVATKLGYSVETETQVMEDIFPRLNTVISNGLLLRYDSYETAAQAFVSQMNSIRPDSDEELASSVWGEDAAAFFVDIIKSAERTGKKIISLRSELADISLLQPSDEELGQGSIYWLYSTHQDELQLDDEDDRLKQLFLEQATDKFYSPMIYQALFHEMEQDLERIKELRRICRVNLHVLNELSETGYTIFPQWITTQALLGMINAPHEQEHLTGAMYVQVKKSVTHCSVDELVDAFLTRMEMRRKTKLNPSTSFKTALYDLFDYIKDLIMGRETVPDTEVIIDMASIDETSLVDMKTITELVQDQYSGSVSDQHLSFYLRGLNWSTVTANEVMDIIQKQDNPGIYSFMMDKLPPSVHEEVTNELLERTDIDESLVRAISIRRLSRPLLEKHVQRYIDQLDPSYILANLKAILAQNVTGELHESEFHLRVFTRLGSEISKDQTDYLLRDKSLMYHMLSALVFCIEFSNQTKYTNGLTSFFKHFTTTEKERMWLMALVVYAGAEYDSGDEIPDSHFKLPPWGAMPGNSMLAFALGITPERSLELQSLKTELQALNLLKPTKEERERYKRDRALYYKTPRK